MKKQSLFILIFMLMANFALAVSNTYNFEIPTVERGEISDHLKIAGCRQLGNIGEPLLPVKGVKLLLSPGQEAVDVNIILGEKVKLQGYFNLPPVQQQYPISYQGEREIAPLKAEIGDSDIPFPKVKHGRLQTQFYAGHGIAFVPIYPVEYLAKTGEAWFYPNISVEIITESTYKADQAYSKFLKMTPPVNSKLETMIHNPEAINQYGMARNIRDEDDYDYLIITSQDLADNFQPLADYKTQHGIETQIHTVEDIYTEYTGMDNPDIIRNFIIDQYQNHNITYLLLGGDADSNDGSQIIPHRGLSYVGVAPINTDYDIPADMYYSCLDGNWNDDGDELWGEAGEDDLIAEVFVGRASVDTEVEADNFVSKTLMYQQVPVVEDLEKALMAGEYLGAEWDVWGSDLKEEIRLGCDNWGYETAGFPDNFDVGTLYDDVGYFWNPMTELLPMYNDGVHIVNHMGHCINGYALKFSTSQINDNNFTNNGVDHTFHINYSQGCYAGAFDNRTTIVGSYTFDSIVEKWTTIENGSVAFIANSRYGFGNFSDTQGPSQYFDREFFDALFGEDIDIIGETQQDSKEDCIWAINYYLNRWSCYGLNLFGDPTLSIWTETPNDFTVEHRGAYPLGMGYLNFTIYNHEGEPFDNARVALVYDGDLLGSATTNSDGQVTLDIDNSILELGEEITLNIIGHNMYPYTEQIPIVIQGSIQGIVKGIDDQPIPAIVYNEETGFSYRANEESGMYSIYFAELGDYILEAELWGYETFTSDPISVSEDDVTEYDIHMIPLENSGSIEGVIQNASGESLQGALVELIGNELPSVLTDESGYYKFSPLIPDVDYGIKVGHENYHSENLTHYLNPYENFMVGFTLYYIEGFETDNGYLSGEGEWTWGEPIASGGPEHGAHSGIKCWGTSLDDLYSVDSDYSLYTGYYQIGDREEIFITFYHWYEFRNYLDGGNVQITLDGGENWQLIYPEDGYPHDTILALSEAGYTFSTEDWEQAVFDISEFVSQGDVFKIRFRFGSTSFTQPNRGWFIDDLTIYGGQSLTDIRDEFVKNIPTYYKLFANYPNPFNPITTIDFELPEKSNINLNVYDVSGKLVKSLINGEIQSGYHSVVWDGKDNNGKDMPSGLFLYRLDTDTFCEVKSCLLLK